ncbi:MAG: hypothetical protein ACT4OP_13735 [Actinomycetota bacterium]
MTVAVATFPNPGRLYGWYMPGRTERKLLSVLDELARASEERRLVEAELEAHRHINDDAQRDATLGIDRLEATATRDDVARFERVLAELSERIGRLDRERLTLQRRLG